jgi:hypothetical protein
MPGLGRPLERAFSTTFVGLDTVYVSVYDTGVETDEVEIETDRRPANNQSQRETVGPTGIKYRLESAGHVKR